MRIEDLLRLWDTYFAVKDPLDLHLYVCISILINCQDVLEELDQSEIKSLLSNLPLLDVDRVSARRGVGTLIGEMVRRVD